MSTKNTRQIRAYCGEDQSIDDLRDDINYCRRVSLRNKEPQPRKCGGNSVTPGIGISVFDFIESQIGPICVDRGVLGDQ